MEPGARRRSGPGGLIRLAAGDSRQRQSAAEELANRAVADDQPLLLQLFSDPDPMVHAIRFLVAARGQQAVKCLMSLLAHRQWQVRAEAAESLGKALEHNASLPMDLTADAYVALIGLLDDGDAFVVSRVVQGLAAVESDMAVEPLVRAAGKHPDLMPKIVELLARSEKVRRKALPHLRSFARHKDPGARAAALRGLVEAFQKAKTSATEIARAAGVQIGPLTALHSASQGRGSSMYGYSGMYGGQTSRAMRTLMERRQSMDSEPAGDEAAGHDLGPLVHLAAHGAGARGVVPDIDDMMRLEYPQPSQWMRYGMMPGLGGSEEGEEGEEGETEAIAREPGPVRVTFTATATFLLAQPAPKAGQ